MRCPGAKGLLPVLLLTLTACGFQLRGYEGSTALPASWQNMHLETQSPNSELSRVMRTRFTASGIRWTAVEEAAYRLQVGPELFAQRNLSINAEARAAEFELTLRTTFAVLDSSGTVLIPADTAVITKQMENDPRNAVGKAEEVRILRNEMRTELADQIIRRIAFFAATRR